MWRSEKTKDGVLYVFSSKPELMVIDVETTGFSSQQNHVIQFSGIKFDISNGTLNEKQRIDLYINPGYPLPEKITSITGITDEMLSDAPIECDVFSQIYDFVGETPVLCGHNSPFDVRFLKTMYERYGRTLEPQIVLDTLEMARDFASSSKKLENNKLSTLSAYYGVDYGLTFHNSMDDVIACSRLLQIFFKEYEEKENERLSSQTTTSKIVAKVQSLRYWAGYRGRSRIYIYTNCGDFFYDVFKKTWGKGNNCFYDVETIDMEQLRADSLKLANATTEKEFARFRG